MTQDQRSLYLIKALLAEQTRYGNFEIPHNRDEQWQLLRALMNVRPAMKADAEFLSIQDEYLTGLINKRGIVDADELPALSTDPRLMIWRGDITALKIDAIVNAANSKMEGCFLPCHDCIDNCIHTFSGIQLRLMCHELMVKQGFEEPTGEAKITPGFNLPAKYILHTVGPIINNALTDNDCRLLTSCYTSCLTLAAQSSCRSVAFCCISTGVFRFPQDKAAQIAVKAVKDYLDNNSSIERVVFNVFTQTDEDIYRGLLS
ncbi:MAG: protein-ADP-ribose hydrolase [Clostridiales bacterium]|nr:protein-ADP-ribose hydrolase [Clostridiales bacterium]